MRYSWACADTRTTQTSSRDVDDSPDSAFWPVLSPGDPVTSLAPKHRPLGGSFGLLPDCLRTLLDPPRLSIPNLKKTSRFPELTLKSACFAGGFS
jgi:hypothetical protein